MTHAAPTPPPTPPVQPDAPTGAVRSRPTGLIVAVIVLAVVAIVGVTTAVVLALTGNDDTAEAGSGGDGGSTFTLRGTMTLEDNDIGDGVGGCFGTGGYSDIRAGASVTVYDAARTVIATGALGEGAYRGGKCIYPIQVANVPAGHDFYAVEVSHRGAVSYPAAKVQDDNVALVLGD